MAETIQNIGWSLVFSFVGGLVGIALVLAASFVVPRLVDRLTPNIDEARELARGNTAVAEFYGRVVAAAILGVSLVAAAAVLGGVVAALH